MKPIVFATHVTTNEWLEERAKPLERSSKYFHPEIPFRIFGPEESADLLSSYPIGRMHPCSGLKAIMGELLSKEFETVVIFDADSIIASVVPEIVNMSSEVAGVRAFTDHGALQNYSPDFYGIAEYEGIVGDRQRWLNGGLTVSKSPSFWTDWNTKNKREVSSTFNIDEGTFNKLLLEKYKGKYEILDPTESAHYYGTASTWGTHHAWESWKTIELRDEKLYLKNIYGVEKQVKVFHEAGHGSPSITPGNRLNLDALFSNEVASFLRKVCE